MNLIEQQEVSRVLRELEEKDRATKPGGADHDWARLEAFYADQSRSQTVSMLRELGLGLKDQTHPIDLASILGQVIDRTATVYRRAPERRWYRGDEAVPEDGPEHKACSEALDLANYDTAWRTADRLRTLQGQVVLRFYPVDERRAVRVRAFHPHRVRRAVSPSCSDLMDEDESFSLELSGGVREVWWRDAQGWRMIWVTRDGRMLDEQPYAATGLRSPYDHLPVQIVYSGEAGGAAWIPPRQSRVAWVQALTAIANDTQALTALQAANVLVYLRDNPSNKPPDRIGPGTVVTVDRTEDLKALPPNAAITQCVDVLKAMARLFATGEGLPGSEFDADRAVLTGAALRVAQEPLHDKRLDQVAMVQQDERAAWRRLRTVWNVHASGWGHDRLSEDLDLGVLVPQLEAPSTETESGNRDARQLAIGTVSAIDLIARERNCTRAEAIQIYERLKVDRERYPAMVAGAASIDGPRPAGAGGPTAPDAAPDAVLGGKASVTDAIRSGGSGADASAPPAPRPPGGEPDAEPAPARAPARPAAPAPDAPVSGGLVAIGTVGAGTLILDVVKAYSAGAISRESAAGMLRVFFGASISEASIQDTLGPEGFKPAASPAPAPGATLS